MGQTTLSGIRFAVILALVLASAGPVSAHLENAGALVQLPPFDDVDAFETYFDAWFALNRIDVFGLAHEGRLAAYAAMTIRYLENKIGRPLAWFEVAAGAWYSESSAIWLWDRDHPFTVGTMAAFSHQVAAYCDGGLYNCPTPVLLLLLGNSWQAFKYNQTAAGTVPLADNVATMLTGDLRIYQAARQVGADIVAASYESWTCADPWVTGLFDEGFEAAPGDPVRIGRVLWVGYFPESLAGPHLVDRQFAVIASCGVRFN